MHSRRFDALARLLASSILRRPLFSVLTAALMSGLGLPEHALACTKLGVKCDRDQDCCDGAECRRRKCRCKSKFTNCGGKCYILATSVLLPDQTFDTSMRRAANTLSRRRSLLALSGAALGVGLAGPITTAAKKKKSKKKKRRCPDPPPPPPCPAPPSPPTCAGVCPSTCDPLTAPNPDPIFCFTRADGALLCATGGDPDCAQTCTSDTDCVGTDRPYCVTSYQIMTTGHQSDVCGQHGAHCTRLTSCT